MEMLQSPVRAEYKGVYRAVKSQKFVLFHPEKFEI